MQVETYEVTELTTNNEEAPLLDDESLALIEQLGLEGQRSFIAERQVGEDDSVKTLNPYRLATKEEFNVFKACFPVETPLQDYESGLIPLRVLQVAAHARTVLPQGTKLVVWHPEDSTVRDPILLGRHEVRYDRKYYLLARWGEALDELGALKMVARRKLKASLTQQVRRIEAEVTAIKTGLDEKVDAHLEGQNINLGYISSVSWTA